MHTGFDHSVYLPLEQEALLAYPALAPCSHLTQVFNGMGKVDELIDSLRVQPQGLHEARDPILDPIGVIGHEQALIGLLNPYGL